MRLMQTSMLSGFSIFVKIITGFLIIKMVAIETGPAGVALMGQFMTLVATLSVIAGGGIGAGVIKYVAQYQTQSTQLKPFLQSSAVYTLFFSLLTMLFCCVFASKISVWILGEPDHAMLIRGLSFAQLFTAENLLIYAVLNGVGQIRVLAMANVLSGVLGLLLMAVLIPYYHLFGALLAVVLSQLSTCLVSVLLVYWEPWFAFLRPSKAKMKHFFDLSRYALMNIISAMTVPVAQILVRNDIKSLMGWQMVGYWQAVLRISDAYLLLVTTVFTAYYLPKFSKLTHQEGLKKELMDAHVKLLPFVALALLVIYLSRNFIISLLYHAEFNQAAPLFYYQLMGDFFRIGAWIITYLLLAKAWTKTYIATEVILSILFVLSSHMLVREYGLIGITYAFALTYFIYWMLMLFVAQFFFKGQNHLIEG